MMPAPRIARKLKPLAPIGIKIREDIEFFRGWLKEPGEVGAIKPTGTAAACKMASVVSADIPLPVLELGPGTGVITRAILDRGIAPEKLHSIEHSEEFYKWLCENFENVNFINGDGFALNETLEEAGLADEKFQAVICAIPLLLVGRKKGVALIDNCLGRMQPGQPLVQISYGPKPPILAEEGVFTVEPLDTIFRNIPPARLWIYRRQN